jgi:hypothetical protein
VTTGYSGYDTGTQIASTGGDGGDATGGDGGSSTVDTGYTGDMHAIEADSGEAFDA